MNHLVKTICGILFLIALGIGGYYWWQAHEARVYKAAVAARPMGVEVVNTPHQNNLLVPPAGFPQELPIEAGHLVSSDLSTFTQGNAKQQSISYMSKATPEAKYALYLSYMKMAGYTVTENKNGTTLSLSGTKAGENLNIVVSETAYATLVQIAHLSFGH